MPRRSRRSSRTSTAAAMTDAITDRGLVEVAGAIRAGEVSSVECTRACLERIDRLQPATNAFIRIDADEALAAASQADEAVARGDDLGPLHGVPLAHKDLLYRAGRVSTGGSEILRDRIAPVTATAASAWTAPVRSISAPSTCPSSRPAAPATTSTTGIAGIRGIPSGRRAVHRAVRAARSRRAWSSARSGPTPAARCACRPRCAASPASSRPTVACRASA